jgi:hypothetical protein
MLELASYSKKSTISSREIQTAVRLILPGELSKHAISEGTKASLFLLLGFHCHQYGLADTILAERYQILFISTGQIDQHTYHTYVFTWITACTVLASFSCNFSFHSILAFCV